MPASELAATLDCLFCHLQGLETENKAACVQLITEQGLMLNICLIFAKTANLSSNYFWTKMESKVIERCFDLYNYLDELELLQYGAGN